MSRRLLALKLPEMVGDHLLQVVDAGNGWPALMQVATPEGVVPIAVHVGPIGLSQRDRDDVERRFQNPGANRPIQAPPGYVPLLIGIDGSDDPPVLVGMDASHRIGRTTRQSLFMPVDLIAAARASGWVERFSSSGEQLIAFAPAMLPIYALLVRASAVVIPSSIADVVAAAGILIGGNEATKQRGREIAARLIRDAKFSKSVLSAYDARCAMCGLNSSLVVGAHIHPVSAPGSVDAVWNGLALCHNHHAAFDTHLVHVEPIGLSIRWAQQLIEAADQNDACGALIRTTFTHLSKPDDRRARPKPEMFTKRYAFFSPRYEWAA
jgi:hypothetical protein